MFAHGIRSHRSLVRSLVAAGAVLVCVVGLATPTAAAAIPGPKVFYAAPYGTGPACSHERPCSLTAAQTKVRQITHNMQRDIVVRLAAGTYQLDQPLTFTAADSGQNGHQVRWQAASGTRPVISGGQSVTGWTLTNPAHNIWSARVPTNLNTRQLYVNGDRAVRARSKLNPPGFTVTPTGYIAPDDSMASWHNISDIEILSNAFWKSFRCGIDHIVGREITMKQPCWANANLQGPPFVPQAPTWIENAFELLNQPGEWYLDRSAHRIFYIPLPGQDMATTKVVAPVLETLVRGAGTVDAPVSNLRFEGLTFSYNTWLEPSTSEGFADVQADFRLVGDNSGKGFEDTDWAGTWQETPAAVDFRAAHDVVFERDVFTHLGSAGLNLETGSQDSAVLGNVFDDVSATAIQLGGISITDHHPDDPRQVVLRNQIKDNYITHAGQEFFGSVGIWSGYTHDTLIAHNELTNLPYTGISSGWGWGRFDPGGNPGVGAGNAGYQTSTTLGGVRITDNSIHDVMQVNEDGGGVYVQSAQHPRSVISGNLIYNVLAKTFSAGLYLDDGSRYFDVSSNVVYNTRATYFVKGGDHRIHDNYWELRKTYVGADQCTTGIFLGPPALNDACQDYYNFDGPNQYVNNHVVQDPADMPSEIVNNAGLEPPYQNIKAGH